MPFVNIFLTVFLAELGDKTQLATLMYATNQSPWLVFGAAALALVASTAIAVMAGQWVATYIPVVWLKLAAGTGFVIIGALTLWEALKPTATA